MGAGVYTIWFTNQREVEDTLPLAESVPNQSMALFAYQAQISQNMLNIVIKDMIRELEAIALLLAKRA